MSEHQFHADHAHFLMSEERRKALPPEKVLLDLDLQEKDKVADLGCGNGFFTIPIAKQTTEMVTAVDAQQAMLDQLRVNIEAEDLSNVRYLLSRLEKIEQPDESVNKVLAAFVLHEVDDLDQTLSEIKRILKPGGKALLLDWKAKETESGPPLHIRIPESDLMKKVEEIGFDLKEVSVSENHYGVLAELPADE
ncbi:class I SAM-dependent methyltransferase [Allobacillus halotolerans]|uniref:Class I SAM-dependent methyltransferase n=1 Tax=Allobacillus halotolerans TaxID=570278 RepID=A0ABS6GP86_9BACI|nr:class I SAM-dependent methyltransferase [Allobacillus halotolerans]MBU6080755.1 class I SAM-dependent methyltransferase [Allobacillus halotolerans]